MNYDHERLSTGIFKNFKQIINLTSRKFRLHLLFKEHRLSFIALIMMGYHILLIYFMEMSSEVV